MSRRLCDVSIVYLAVTKQIFITCISHRPCFLLAASAAGVFFSSVFLFGRGCDYCPCTPVVTKDRYLSGIFIKAL